MSRPPLESTPIGTNTPNARISDLDLTPVGTKTPYPKPLTLPTESSKRKEKSQKEYVRDDTESYPSLSDSSLSETDWSNDSKYR